APAKPPPDLASASLEELMNIQVTSASRKEQRAMDVAAAVYVISSDDIRRSGLLSVPEILRLAPGVQVARVDGNKWAVSIRGFNSRWSNKLLVMIDGRTVYQRLQSGVAWDIVSPPIEDIDRIEVVRGPGGSLWGANAVNGIINILTTPASATSGRTMRITGGTLGTIDFLAEYGGRAGAAAYRASFQGSRRGESDLPDSANRARDQVRDVSGHFRVDWTGTRDKATLQGDVQGGHSGTVLVIGDGPIPPPNGWQPLAFSSDRRNGNLLARWERKTGDHSDLQVQTFIDLVRRREVVQDYRATTFDVDVQYRVDGHRHDIVAGGAFRFIDDHVAGSPSFSVSPVDARILVINSFAQDEIAFAGDRVAVTVGAKLEHDTFGGWAFQPNTRVMWKITSQQRLWGAWSHAIRSPSRFDRGVLGRLPSFIGPDGLPIRVTVLGNENYQSEGMHSTEVGYRLASRQEFSVDVSAFVSRHDRLATEEPISTALQFDNGRPYIDVILELANNLSADTRGAELTARWTPAAARVRLDAGVSMLHLTPHPGPSTRDQTAVDFDGSVPRYQWRVGPTIKLGPHVDLTAMVFGVSRLRNLAIPGYTRADVALEWRLRPKLSIATAGNNLFGPGHVEFGGIESAATQILLTRTATARLTWRF
ncbi:MAG: TonB-dependent receptor, partial [Acidobacteriota bacterium]